eukprot:Nitzschia sp. Nitz4//scaffold95_size97785//83992//85790//NITZ4_004678-RA/size97785-augustus-gene-0.112-mRNA-1//-1//CDS//3329560505//5717//frame0
MEATKKSPEETCTDSLEPPPSSTATSLEAQMQNVLELLTQRASGKASNAQIDSAVSTILTDLQLPQGKSESSKPAASRHTGKRPLEDSLDVDTGNYDDDDDDDNTDPPKRAPLRRSRRKVASRNPAPAKKESSTQKESQEKRSQALQEIPMGVVGAKMMTTFGDGSTPCLDALKAALDATRRSIQCTILDARAVRRRAKESYQQARIHAVGGTVNPSSITTNNESALVDPAMSFRAHLTQLGQHDKLNYQQKCGFDMEQLTWLYPEEMRAYERWNEMHNAYESSQVDEQTADDQDLEDPAAKETADADKNNDSDEELGGHLKERAAVFDVRTLHMAQDGYARFAEIRKGSFLARQPGRISKIDKEWNKMPYKGGGMHSGSWNHMPANAVRFLHWLGFEPPTYPPPNDETTHALGFLAYDRMGRVVELAIYLRNLAKEKEAAASAVDPKLFSLRELKEGEQLTVADIERAVKELDIKPAAHYNIGKGDDNMPNVQLYFGPGFERRLELEMEEFLAASKKVKLSEEEDKIRQEEVEMFQKMSKPYDQTDVMVRLVEERKAEQESKRRDNSSE